MVVNMKKRKMLGDYRIPIIEEFVEGFRYEVFSEGKMIADIEDRCGWYTYQFKEGYCWRVLDDIKLDLINENIRVLI